MAKLTKQQAKDHLEAEALLTKDTLNDDEREFIYRNWNEAAATLNTTIGAHFTPVELALDFAIDAWGHGRVLDICAGIGVLSQAMRWRDAREGKISELVCIEQNPEYVRIGRLLLPEARWIEADAFDLPRLGLGHFNSVVSNPPFGNSAKRSGNGPRYTGRAFELHLIDMVADHADHGAFLIPQNSAPFEWRERRAPAPKPRKAAPAATLAQASFF